MFNKLRFGLSLGAAGGAAVLLAWSAVGAAESGQADQGGEITRAQMIAYSCFSCHDRTGEGIKSMPPISGFSEEQMAAMLKDFKDNGDGVTVMDRHATGYSDEDIREVAAYLANMEWPGEVDDE
ncbi:c-type cytochrome [Halorhodospira halochloris]|uniref:Cytochrome c class I n=1 Tax=Halorhodospira halochloris TaxID=1052 RepID=A0A0X8X885_HALHR|nr:c-type cytochrome [Halorhodospira halochloris]MBK1651136.1 hypothetical protein [Halorhodospira halochloris]MCG5531200.1 c-type cytochrome [Halorhodospira halochloris]MCG5547709.1 c-type cytochrome [Halorhodospira halochloris]BAU57405.2 cytochrome c class I [Halorhodospira halochloris]